MCIICDGGTVDEVHEQVAGDIHTIGWSVAAVEGPPGSVWAYTVGLLERFAHPELVINGACCTRCAHWLLNRVAGQVVAGRRLEVGDEIDDGEGTRRARVGSVHPRHWQTSLFNIWLDFYDRRGEDRLEPRALQLIVTDHRGRSQDDAANRRWRRQRLDRPPHTGRR